MPTATPPPPRISTYVMPDGVYFILWKDIQLHEPPIYSLIFRKYMYISTVDNSLQGLFELKHLNWSA